jgi:hypothetical protein
MKKLLTILFAVALGLNLSAQVPDYVPTDGLVAWYPFNGNGEDSSNNGNDLIQIGDPIWGEVEGRPFVDLPGDGEHFYHPLDSFPVAEEFSIAMWIRIDVQHGSGSVGSVAPIASKHYSGAAGLFRCWGVTKKLDCTRGRAFFFPKLVGRGRMSKTLQQKRAAPRGSPFPASISIRQINAPSPMANGASGPFE